MKNQNPYKNHEGYPDLTAYHGIRLAEKDSVQNRANTLIHVLKYIIQTSGFELVARIELRDRRSGKVFK